MSHVWAADGARAQARSSTGDVLGGLPPEKSRGLRAVPPKAKDGSLLHSESLSRMDGTG